MTLHLIRHGITEANEKKLYLGHTDLSLSKKGRLELIRLKDEIKYPLGEIYVTSGLKRADETLMILYDKKPDLKIKEFMELNFGDFEMKSYDDLKLDKDYIKWVDNFPKEPCPNGENREDFLKRIQYGIGKLKELKLNEIVVICHGGVIASIMEQYLNKKNFYDFLPSHGHGYTICFENEEILDYFKF